MRISLSAIANVILGVCYSWKRWMGEEYREHREKIWRLHGCWKPVVARIQMAGPKQAGDWHLGVEVLEQQEVSNALPGTPRWRPVSVFTWIVGLGFFFIVLVWFGVFFWVLFLVSLVLGLLGSIAAEGSCRCEVTSADPIAVCLHA